MLRARTAKSSICNDQLLLEDVGLYLYCTRLGHHSGLHEARDLEDKVVASWPIVVDAGPRLRGGP